MTKRLLSILVVLLSLGSQSLSAATLYVDGAATGLGNGTTWTDAFDLFEDALAAASPTDEIWVAQGTYRPTSAGGDRSTAFSLTSDVQIYGGFEGGTSTTYPGGESQREQRDPAAHLTILSGDLNGDDAPDFANTAENSHHVLAAIGIEGALLDGFTINGGNADGEGDDQRGGGLLVTGGSLVVSNCRFVANQGGQGGAICLMNGAEVSITACTLLDNGADFGGAAYCLQAQPTWNRCAFFGNAAGYGGGLYNEQCNPIVTNCLFSGNLANQYGGGVRNYNAATPLLVNCTFAQNWAAVAGGGLACRLSSNLTMSNCILWGNIVPGNTTQSAQLLVESNSLPNSSYNCCVQGGTGGLGGSGNISVNPQYIDGDGSDGIAGTEDDNLRLSFGSPCIDAGRNDRVPSGISLDLAGQPRFINELSTPDTGVGTPPIVDIGAYEIPVQQAVLITGIPLSVPEDGTAFFTVRLSDAPEVPVTVTVSYASGDPDITVLAGSSLNFNSGNYSLPQNVTLAAAEDVDLINGRTWFNITSPVITTIQVLAIEEDNEPLPERLYVDVTATGSGQGTSWADAILSLSDALDVARYRPGIPEIWVAKGTYRPAGPSGDRTHSFSLVSNVKVYGGFEGAASIQYPGGETQLDQRDRNLNLTILSGDLNGNDGPNYANYGENSYHVVTGLNLVAGTVLDGFIIRSGNAAGSSSNAHGGGCYLSSSHAVIRNCKILGNRAVIGGGVYVGGSSGQTSFVQCVFSGNYATDRGGAMQVDANSNPQLINCTFSFNAANTGGGIGKMDFTNGTALINCILWANRTHAGVTNEQAQIYEFWKYGSTQVNYTCIMDWTGSYGGTGNTGGDPRFADPDGADNTIGTLDDDYQLQAGSACIDAGSNALVPVGLTVDMKDQPRFVEDPATPDTGAGTPPIIDMGPYESPPNQGFIITGTPVAIHEGSTAQIAIRLAQDPGESIDVLVAHVSGDADISVANGSLLTFDSGNWSVAQPVELAAAEDPDFANGSAVVRVSSGTIFPRELTVQEIDNEPVPVTVYVDRDATGSNLGTSWANALTDLRVALEAIAGRSATPEVWVANGVYTPAPPTGDRSTSFELISGVGLYGGFAGGDSVEYPGGETQRVQRRPAQQLTILSGDLNGNDGPNYTNYTDNSYHVVASQNLSASTILDGFVVIGGNATGSGNSFGGGCYFSSSQAVVRNCKLLGNRAISGGGIYEGGSSGQTTFVQCVFSGNYAVDRGGAIQINTSSNSRFINCTLSSNEANAGGGIGKMDFTNGTTLTNCILWGNRNHTGIIGQSTQIYEFWKSGFTQFSYSCVQGWDGSYGGTGNFGTDPRLVDANGPDNMVGTLDDDVRLLVGSPCVDAANNQAVPAGLLLDLNGDSRFVDDPSVVDTGIGTPPIVDMGAYESSLRLGFIVDGEPVIAAEGASGFFSISLSLDPTQPLDVTVAVIGGDPDLSIVSGGTLHFDSSNWATPQPVEVAAAEDADFSNGTATIRLTAATIAPRDITAREIDNEPIPVPVYVDSAAIGSNTGMTWGDAFVELRDALAALTSRGAPAEVWVAQGTYKPAPPSGARKTSFTLKAGLQLYGGFAGGDSLDYPGGEISRDQRDPTTHISIMSGDLNGNDGPNFSNYNDNSYHVVSANNIDNSAVLDGFLVIGGNANGPAPDDAGGGMLNITSSPVVTGCIFTKNRAGASGGGMANRYSASPIITGCTFFTNAAPLGAGMANFSNTNPHIANCFFAGNTATNGGGMANTEICSPLIVNCAFTGNIASGFGGGVRNDDRCSPPISNWRYCQILWIGRDQAASFLSASASFFSPSTN